MDLMVFAQIMTAVGMVLGGQKGMEIYKRKRFANGNGGQYPERRRNSFSNADKDFIRGCFSSLELSMENDRLKTCRELEEAIRDEGKQTRDEVRSLRT